MITQKEFMIIFQSYGLCPQHQFYQMEEQKEDSHLLFLNTVHDSLDGILSTWSENVWLASNGGGIGTYWGEVRSI